MSGAARSAGGAARALARHGLPLSVRGRNEAGRAAFASAEELVADHFRRLSDPDHVNRSSMLETILLLEEQPSVILETGSSAWGTNSSRLFDAYVAAYGGEFETVDIRIGPLLRLPRDLSRRSVVTCDDSVRFLRRWVERNAGRAADLVYLDSFDVDAANPTPAAVHALLELEAIRPALAEGSLLLVDDTPSSLDFFDRLQRPAAESFAAATGLVPGKGMLIDVYLRSDPAVTKVHHGYQALYRF